MPLKMAGWLGLGCMESRVKSGRKDVGSGARDIMQGRPVPPFTSCGVSGSLLNHPMFQCHFLENKRLTPTKKVREKATGGRVSTPPQGLCSVLPLLLPQRTVTRLTLDSQSSGRDLNVSLSALCSRLTHRRDLSTVI